MADRVQLFADALFTIAQASPQPAEIEDELLAVTLPLTTWWLSMTTWRRGGVPASAP